MDVSRYVFDVGDTVTGWGEIVQDDDGIWFDRRFVDNLVWTEGTEPRTDVAVKLIAADPREVTVDIADGYGPGWASITGIWRDSSIEVLAQTTARPARLHPEPTSDWTTPPCPPPSGGWPTGPIDATDDDLKALHASENVVEFAVCHPAIGATVLIVEASDLAAVEAEFRPRYRDRLCVVRSRWTKQQLHEIAEVFDDHWEPWALSMWGRAFDEQARSMMHVSLFRVRVMPDMAAWARGLPEGILRISAALTRV